MSTNPKYFKRTNNTPRKFGQIDFTRATYVNDKLKVYFRFPFWPREPFQKSAFISSIKCGPCIEINKQKHKSIVKDFPCILSTDSQFIACAFCLISDRTSQCLTRRQRERAIKECMSQTHVDSPQVDEIKPHVDNSKEREEGECEEEEEKQEEVEAEMKSCHPKVSNKRKRQADSIDKSEKDGCSKVSIQGESQDQDDGEKRVKFNKEEVNDSDCCRTENLIKIKAEHVELDAEVAEEGESSHTNEPPKEQICDTTVDRMKDNETFNGLVNSPLKDYNHAIENHNLKKKLERCENENQIMRDLLHLTIQDLEITKLNLENANRSLKIANSNLQVTRYQSFIRAQGSSRLENIYSLSQ